MAVTEGKAKKANAKTAEADTTEQAPDAAPTRALVVQLVPNGEGGEVFSIEPHGINPFEIPTLLRKAALIAEQSLLNQ